MLTNDWKKYMISYYIKVSHYLLLFFNYFFAEEMLYIFIIILYMNHQTILFSIKFTSKMISPSYYKKYFNQDKGPSK